METKKEKLIQREVGYRVRRYRIFSWHSREVIEKLVESKFEEVND